MLGTHKVPFQRGWSFDFSLLIFKIFQVDKNWLLLGGVLAVVVGWVSNELFGIIDCLRRTWLTELDSAVPSQHSSSRCNVRVRF